MSAVLEREYITGRQDDALLIVEMTDEGFRVLWNINFLSHAAGCADCTKMIEDVLRQIRPSLDETRKAISEPTQGATVC